MLCSLMLALLRLAAGAEECAGVEFLEGHVTHARQGPLPLRYLVALCGFKRQGKGRRV